MSWGACMPRARYRKRRAERREHGRPFPGSSARLLRPVRERERPRGIATTKAGTLLKHKIPIRTFAEWDDIRPGFLEADSVAHCGTSAEGAYLHTLVLTDVATGWTECLPLLHRSQDAVVQALDQAQRRLPFPPCWGMAIASKSWPVALRHVQGWLDPWTMLWRYWRVWSSAPPPPALQALLDAVGNGQPPHLPLRI